MKVFKSDGNLKALKRISQNQVCELAVKYLKNMLFTHKNIESNMIGKGCKRL